MSLASGQQSPVALVVDATSVYWTTYQNGVLMKVPKDGGSVTTLASWMRYGGTWVGTLAIDTQNLYWTASLLPTRSNATMTMPTGGGAPTTLVAGLGGVIAVDDATLYLGLGDVPSNTETLVRVSKGCSARTTLASGTGFPDAIAVDSNSLYWTDEARTVSKVPKGGGAVTVLASGQAAPYAIATDGTNVYWMNQGYNGTLQDPGQRLTQHWDGDAVGEDPPVTLPIGLKGQPDPAGRRRARPRSRGARKPRAQLVERSG